MKVELTDTRKSGFQPFSIKLYITSHNEAVALHNLFNYYGVVDALDDNGISAREIREAIEAGINLYCKFEDGESENPNDWQRFLSLIKMKY